ncbi:hypothetical protein PLCT1_00903 [Planctomycetaceae bacterium]|nr:hypothetical protein PLCT1_00903 [Planctomycetaceae bacterium]
MIRWITTIAVLISAALIAPLTTVAVSLTTTDDKATLEFPDRLTFSVNLKHEIAIERVILEYGVNQLTCGSVVAKAFPDVISAKAVDAEWVWEMKQTGSVPPGSTIWWRWRVVDTQGLETVTNQKSIVWLDDQHDWQTITGDDINLHWYDGDRSFGEELHTSAVKSLNDLAQATGLHTNTSIDLYIYADTADMRDSILYEPGWTGGLAYSDHNIVLIGIAPDQIDWGKRTQAHELTHVLVGQLTFSCLSDIPTWLQEGLAVYGEGGPEDASQRQLDQAIKDDDLLSVRSLSGNFSEDPAKADLSYSQSYSLVKFLIEKYNQDKMTALLKALRDGHTVDDALQSVYGFDVDGFEDAWRAFVKAPARQNAAQSPTPTPEPTQVPTVAPISIAQAGPTAAPPRDRPTPTPIAVAATTNDSTTSTVPAEVPATDNTLVMVIIAIAIGLVLIIGLALIVISRRRQGMSR